MSAAQKVFSRLAGGRQRIFQYSEIQPSQKFRGHEKTRRFQSGDPDALSARKFGRTAGRQAGFAHQELVHTARGFASFGNGPDDE